MKSRILMTILGILGALTADVFASKLPRFADYFQSSPLGKVQTKERGPFVVSWVHPRDEIIVDALLEHLTRAEKLLAPQFRNMSGDQKKIPVEIFPDLKSFSDVSGLSRARFKATGTIALTLDQRLMILSPRNLTGGYSWAVTVVHELIHYLIREINPENVPIWLHEGTAQVFQGYPQKKEWNLQPSQWGLFKKAKQNKKLLSLETLKEPFPYRKDPEEAELAYIQAFLFAQWLDKKCGVVELIRMAQQTQDMDKALTQCTQMSLSELSRRFIPEILGSFKIPETSDVKFYARDYSGVDPVDLETRNMDRKSKDFAQLANELFKQGRYKASTIEMEKAFKSTPVHPPSWSRQLATAYEKSNQSASARQVLDRLLQDYPEDAGGWYLLGQQKLRSADAPGAWRAFLNAFFVNPFMDGLMDDMKALEERHPDFSFSMAF